MKSHHYTCPAGGVLAVEGLVAVELGQFQLFHVELREVAVEVQWADVMKAWLGVLQPLASQRNVHQEGRLTRSLDHHAQLHSSTYKPSGENFHCVGVFFCF